MTPVDLYTARGEFVRHCTDVAQARETVHQIKPGAYSITLSEDHSTIGVKFRKSRKVYTYEVRQPTRRGAEQ